MFEANPRDDKQKPLPPGLDRRHNAGMRTVGRSISVSLAHRCWNPAWDADRNALAYGDLASPVGIGSNLRVQIKCADERDLQPGFDLIKRLLDHRALFADEPEFRNRASSLEAIVDWLELRLIDIAPSLIEILVYDGPRVRCRGVVGQNRIAFSERVGNLWLTQHIDRALLDRVVVRRGEGARAVSAVAARFGRAWPGGRASWGRRLLMELQHELPNLTEVTIVHGPGDVQRVGAPDAAKTVDFNRDLGQLESLL